VSDFKNLFGDWEPEEGSNASQPEGYELEPENRAPREIVEKEVTIANVVEEIYYPAGHAQGRHESSMWVLLKDARGREFKIVMLPELGRSILQAMRGEVPDRPFTHDLFRVVVERLGGALDKVVIDDLWQDTFYAKLHIRVGEDRVVEIDARPSDAIAIALRFRAPIFVSDTVLDATQHTDEA
jgi:bifunctional DNase/RNase